MKLKKKIESQNEFALNKESTVGWPISTIEDKNMKSKIMTVENTTSKWFIVNEC